MIKSITSRAAMSRIISAIIRYLGIMLKMWSSMHSPCLLEVIERYFQSMAPNFYNFPNFIKTSLR